MSKYTVLVWPCTTELGREAVRALRDDKDVGLVLASSEADVLMTPDYWLPDVSNPLWSTELKGLRKEYGVTHILPCHDAVLQALAEEIDFEEPAAYRVLAPPRLTVLACLSKSVTYNALQGVVPIPVWEGVTQESQIELILNRVRKETARLEVSYGPILVKPDAGNASRGVAKNPAAKQVREAMRLSRNGYAVVCEYLPGPEFTVDCFSGGGKLLWTRARERLATQSGISVATRRLDYRCAEEGEFREWARRIHEKLGMRGAWFFQAKLREDGSPVLLEVAPRFGGGAALARTNGVNLPLLTLYERLGIPLTIADRDDVPELTRPLANRYRLGFSWDALYVDLDDTLVCKGKVNPRLLALCAQALNAGKAVRVLSRSGESVETLDRLQRLLITFAVMGEGTFFKVPAHQSKADFLASGERAVFVDDSFREREDVRARLGIPVFDAAGAECLLEDL